MLVDMDAFSSNTYAIRFAVDSGFTWFDCHLFASFSDAVIHADKMREWKGFCDSYSIDTVEHWLDSL